MKVLFPIEGDGGGAVTHVLTLAKGLRQYDISSLVVFLTEGPSVAVARNMGLHFKKVVKGCLLDPLLIGRLTVLMDWEKIDVVHTHTIRGNYYGRLAAALCKRSMVNVTTVHSHIPDELRGGASFDIKDRLLCRRESLLWPWVDYFICVSEKIRQRLLTGGIAEKKAEVIGNGVELPDPARVESYKAAIRAEFGIGDNDIVIGTVGRLVPLKNHELLLKTAREVSKKIRNVRFLVVGDGPLHQQLVDRSAKMGLSGVVTFTGWRDDIQSILSAVDIYVICSVVEGLNISVLEAMACGKPVIGTDVKGISELVVSGENGFLVPLNDVAGMAASIVELIQNPAKRGTMGLNGRRQVESKYSVKRMVYDTSMIYERLYSCI